MIIENEEEASFVVIADALEEIEGQETVELKSQVDETSEIIDIKDKNGKVNDWSDIYVITGVGYTVVFLALILLIYVYKLLPKILNLHLKKRLKREGKDVSGKVSQQYVIGEVNAAIATALILYFNEQHDEESNIITIKRVARTYSPWSSKIYGINNILPSK